MFAITAFAIQPVTTPMSAAARSVSRQWLMAAAVLAGALAPWVLLVTAYGGLGRSAAACFTGPLAL